MRHITNTQQRLAVMGKPWRLKNGVLVPDQGWARENLRKVFFPSPLPLSWDKAREASSAQVHRLLVAQVTNAFQELHDKKLWGLFHTYGGSYNVRFSTGSATAPSAHCWGAALDFDADLMPRGSHARWPDEVVEVFTNHGFVNGAGFHTPDPMHWEARGVYP